MVALPSIILILWINACSGENIVFQDLEIPSQLFTESVIIVRFVDLLLSRRSKGPTGSDVKPLQVVEKLRQVSGLC